MWLGTSVQKANNCLCNSFSHSFVCKIPYNSIYTQGKIEITILCIKFIPKMRRPQVEDLYISAHRRNILKIDHLEENLPHPHQWVTYLSSISYDDTLNILSSSLLFRRMLSSLASFTMKMCIVFHMVSQSKPQWILMLFNIKNLNKMLQISMTSHEFMNYISDTFSNFILWLKQELFGFSMAQIQSTSMKFWTEILSRFSLFLQELQMTFIFSLLPSILSFHFSIWSPFISYVLHFSVFSPFSYFPIKYIISSLIFQPIHILHSHFPISLAFFIQIIWYLSQTQCNCITFSIHFCLFQRGASDNWNKNLNLHLVGMQNILFWIYRNRR